MSPSVIEATEAQTPSLAPDRKPPDPTQTASPLTRNCDLGPYLIGTLQLRASGFDVITVPQFKGHMIRRCSRETLVA